MSPVKGSVSPSQIRIADLWQNGKTPNEIAVEMGMSPSTVRKAICRAQQRDPTLRTVDQRDQRHPQYEKILELWNIGRTGGQIVLLLGVTRGAVMGVISRARINGVAVRSPRAVPKTSTMAKNISGFTPKVSREHGYPFGGKVTLVVDKDEGYGIPLLKLTEDCCRYPTGRHSGQHLFCGEAKRDYGTSYCAEHHELVWVKRQDRTKEESRKLELHKAKMKPYKVLIHA